MNKQELLEEIVKLDIEVSENFPHYDLVGKEVVLALIDQLDEPEKTVIPQKIADFIEKYKGKSHSLAYAINSTEVIKWFSEKHRDEWLYSNERENLFARAWLDGYEVEEEKEYYVVLPAKGKDMYLNYDVQENVNFDDYKGTRFTEAEIKAIDERYWAFADEVTE